MRSTSMHFGMDKVPIVLGAVFVAIVLLAIYIRGGPARAAKGRPEGARHLGWALLFLTSGRVPPPPPETQIEVELNGEKDRGASDPLRDPPEGGPSSRP
jgi:hypothetical protein